jgi:formylglycine-generating enzyme required for sulfatase activity
MLKLFLLLSAVAEMMIVGRASGALVIETVPVGNPGNPGDRRPMTRDGTTGYGRVDYVYNIGKYEVTAGQYTAFLNSVAQVDTHHLYDFTMRSAGVTQSGSGTLGAPYTYSVGGSFSNRPMRYVPYWSAYRFANWLHNGQPSGAQGAGTTEAGAYTMTATPSTIRRNGDWQWAVSNEDEWYKAAYHKNDGVTGNYFLYPACSDTAPGRDMADVTGNNANWHGGSDPYPIETGNYTTIVGEFQNSPGPYGTFDQGGNVWEWNETDLSLLTGEYHCVRGGSYSYGYSALRADTRGYALGTLSYDSPLEFSDIGFRVVWHVPEPAGGVLILTIAAVCRRGCRRSCRSE